MHQVKENFNFANKCNNIIEISFKKEKNGEVVIKHDLISISLNLNMPIVTSLFFLGLV